MDVRMPGIDGIEATRRLASPPGPDIKILILTTFPDDEYVYGALRAGASGFLLKRASPEGCSTLYGPSRPARPCSTRRSPAA